MSLFQTLEIYKLIDKGNITGEIIADLFRKYKNASVSVNSVTEAGRADFIKIKIPGRNGKTKSGSAPTIGIIGRNGACGARPNRLGLVSDADGVITALATALKILDFAENGDRLEGDVIVSTHISIDADIPPDSPAGFMGMPVSSATMNKYEVYEEMDAILSADTSKGNEVLNHTGFAITPTALKGYVLRVSPSLLHIMKQTTGELPNVMPITNQDITDYDNGVYHINSIMQPHVATCAPVVGVAITAHSAVAGSASNASREVDIASAVRFCTEVAIQYTDKTRYNCEFFDKKEYERLVSLYGELSFLQRKI